VATFRIAESDYCIHARALRARKDEWRRNQSDAATLTLRIFTRASAALVKDHVRLENASSSSNSTGINNQSMGGLAASGLCLL
jgi:hypothetical protein